MGDRVRAQVGGLSEVGRHFWAPSQVCVCIPVWQEAQTGMAMVALHLTLQLSPVPIFYPLRDKHGGAGLA